MLGPLSNRYLYRLHKSRKVGLTRACNILLPSLPSLIYDWVTSMHELVADHCKTVLHVCVVLGYLSFSGMVSSHKNQNKD